MTKRFLAVLLSAVVMIPAAAQAQDRGGGDRNWGDRGAQRGNGGQNRGDVARPAPVPQQARPDRPSRPERSTDLGDRGRPQRGNWQDRNSQNGFADRDGNRGRPGGWQEQEGRGQFAGQGQRYDNRGQVARQGQRYDNRGQFAGQGQGQRYDNRGQWNRGWREDRRYDWNGYRAQNRSAYRLPRYYAPVGRGYGYGYRRFGIGLTLGSAYFGQNYWISDPWSYRLPDAYGPYRWVRYYGDALLIDLRGGQVVDAIYDIFG